MYMGNKKSPLQVLEKRIPKNPKYANVKGQLDTGRTVSKMRTVSTKEFMKRRSEIYERLRPSVLAQMMRLELRDELLRGGDVTNNQDEDVADQEKEKGELEHKEDSSTSSRTTWNSKDMARQEAEQEAQVRMDAKLKNKTAKSFLLLDVRSRQEYDECHIASAVNYGLAAVHQDKVLPEMYYFKNKESKYIVVYDDDERTASKAAKEMVEKGYENVYLLSHGLKAMGNFHPDCIVGQLPSHLVKPLSPSPRSLSRRSSRGGRNSSSGSIMDGGSTIYNGSVSGFSSTYSVSSRTSTTTFGRAPRFHLPREEKQAHNETINRILRSSR